MLDILVQTRNASSGIKAATPDLLKKKTELCTHTQTEHADTREPATASWEKTHHGNTEVGPLFRRRLNKEGGEKPHKCQELRIFIFQYLKIGRALEITRCWQTLIFG